jgi:hypothetical protein
MERVEAQLISVFHCTPAPQSQLGKIGNTRWDAMILLVQEILKIVPYYWLQDVQLTFLSCAKLDNALQLKLTVSLMDVLKDCPFIAAKMASVFNLLNIVAAPKIWYLRWTW